MDAAEFQRQLRERLGLHDITVRRDPAWAGARGFHPDAWQVWDTGRQSGAPYCAFVCEKEGLPVEPAEWMFPLIRAASFDRKAPAPGAYVDEVEQRERRRAEDVDRMLLENFDRMWSGLEVEDQVQSAAGKTQKWNGY